MPELPEVETTRRGIAPWLKGRALEAVVVREPRLRWRIAAELPASVAGRRIKAVDRRAKYIVIGLSGQQNLLLHLGMSGSLRLVPADEPVARHDHVDLVLSGGQALRLTDPRRFGSLHLIKGDPLHHPLLAHLGPEPLGPDFDGDRLYTRSRGRRTSVKAFIMDSHVVVGVGNIYAAEALWRAGIHPHRPAGRVGRKRYRALAAAVKAVLSEAIAIGGTTLRDFTAADGRPGYFRQRLEVYGRCGQACNRCGRTLRARRIAQRTTVFCPGCQR